MSTQTHPVIVVEGLDGVGKSTLTTRLAHALGATLLRTPPALGLSAETPLGTDLRRHFDESSSPAARRMFYRFANLLVSEMSRVARRDGPVVIDRYWPSTVAFSMGTGDGAGLAEWLGRYPEELLVPDAMLLLTVDEAGRMRRFRGRAGAATGEELLLERNVAARREILAAYSSFRPLVVDTSTLHERGVLLASLDLLHAAGVLTAPATPK